MKTRVIQDEQDATERRSTAPSTGAGGTVAIVIGAVVLVLGLALLAGGAFGLWAVGKRDASGFFMTGTHALSTPTRALVTDRIDVDGDTPDELLDADFATVRIQASASEPVFVGIGRTRDVSDYLAGVRHAAITDVDVDPFRVTSREVGGGLRPSPPASQGFWAAQSGGAGTRTLTWPLESGRWSAVVMNADASPGVDVRTRFGAKVPALQGVATGVLVGGVLLTLLGGLLVWVGARRPAER
jgi:hypothetical protein